MSAQIFLIALIICSLSMSVLALLYMAISPLLGKRYSEKGRYYTWLIILVGLIIPFRPQWGNSLIGVEIPVDTPQVIFHIAGNTQNITVPPVALPTVGNPPVSDTIHNTSPGTNPDVIPSVVPGTGIDISWWQIVMPIWLAGLIFFIAYHGIKHYRFIKMTRRWGKPVIDEQVISLYGEVKAEMGISRGIPIFLCKSIGSPMLVGLIKPRILLPTIEYENDELRFILRHELVHYKRWDLLYRCIVLIATAIHWFNPIVYMIAKQINMLCELSCDAEIVQNTDDDARQQYGEAIMGVAQYQSKFKTALSTEFYGGKKGMKNRISSIMDTRKKRIGAVVLLVAVVATLSTGIILAASANVANIAEIAGSDEYSDSQNDMYTEAVSLTMEDFYESMNEWAERHGMYGFSETVSISPDVIYLFSSLEEWQADLEETWFSFVDDSERIFAEMNQFGHEPLHDVTVVTFSGEHPISVYIELDAIDLGGREIYPARVGNHDHVLLPLEPVFDMAGILYVWDDSTNRLYLEGLAYDLILEPGQEGVYIPFRPTGADLPVLLERKASGLYIHSLIFDFMLKEVIFPEFPDPALAYVLVPLIYHDLNKVVLVTHERTHYINYASKRAAMGFQFERVNYPLGDEIIFDMGDFSLFDHQIVPIELLTGRPFVVSSKYYDYIMIPVVEILELLDVYFIWDEADNSVVIPLAGQEHHIREGEPVFPVDRDWVMRFHHDIAPMLVEDTLFISHSDFRRIIIFHGASVFVDRRSSRLNIHAWGS